MAAQSFDLPCCPKTHPWLGAICGGSYVRRFHLGLETGEICKELGLTSTHCWVLLYRARMALRKCRAVNAQFDFLRRAVRHLLSERD